MSDKLRILRNAERRVAALIAESVHAAPGFQANFLDLMAERCGLDFSVSEPRVDLRPDVFGEKDGYDFATHARAGETRLVFLVTVAARFEAPAAARAREAADRLREQGTAAFVFTALVVAADPPEDAAATGAAYDAVLRFREVRPFLEAEAAGLTGELGQRLAFQRRGFEGAERAIEAVFAGALGPATFREAYLDFVAATEAALPVAAAAFAGEGADPDKIVFDADALPRWDFMARPRLAHHLSLGLVSILIDRWGEHIEALAGLMEPTLSGTGFSLAPGRSPAPGAPSGLLIVAEAPALDPEKPFETQRADVWEGLRTAVALKRWWLGRKAAARYWAETADPSRPQGPEGRIRRDLAIG